MGVSVTTLQFFLTAWSWYPSVIAGCVLLLLLYPAAARPLSASHAAWYAAGVLVLFLALVSPLDALGDDYLFSAHMIQHLLLVLVAAPLLLLGISRTLAARLLDRPWIAWLEGKLSRPPVAWLLGIGTLWVWHLPVLYNATLASERIHITEHLSFLVTGVIFWWPVLSPLSDHRLRPGPAIIYIFSAGVANTILGIILTFVPVGLYPHYLHPEDELGALSLIRNGWGLSAATDQQLGGLFMWVGGGLVFLVAILGILRRWYLSQMTDNPSLGARRAQGQETTGKTSPRLRPHNEKGKRNESNRHRIDARESGQERGAP
jgi:cytochrome c oxidase assembly factor CtaG